MDAGKSSLELPAIDFYGFVGVVVPGTVLLISIGLLFKIEKLDPLLAPENIGGLGIHLIIAYIVGHLLQSIGNVIETVYWRLWQGKPTEWPISPRMCHRFTNAIDIVCKYTENELPPDNHDEKIKKWKFLVSQVRAGIYASGRSARLQVFVGNYGMFRGVLAALVILALIGWKSTDVQLCILYPVLILTGILTIQRMHRFGTYYAKELFANAAELTQEKNKDAN